MSQLFINDLDPDKDKKVNDFLSEYHSGDSVTKLALVTDADHDMLFCKLAEEWSPESYAAFEEKVKETFEGKLDAKLEKWAKNLTLDRAKLKRVFG